MKSILKRAGWILLALLFVGTGLGVGVIAFWQAIHQKNSNSANVSTSNSSTPKLAGTKLANFTPVAKVDSLQKIDLTPGSGTAVKAGDTVTADYTGAVAATGIIFQSSKDAGQPATFPIRSPSGSQSGVIEGWVQGVPGMQVGGTRRLLIPAAMAYGPNPPASSGIPANADLVFDITLFDVK